MGGDGVVGSTYLEWLEDRFMFPFGLRLYEVLTRINYIGDLVRASEDLVVPDGNTPRL